MSSVVLVAHDQDEHADAVHHALSAMGARVIRISRAYLPTHRFTWSPGGHAHFGAAEIGPSAGFWRRPGQPDLATIASEFAAFAGHECEDAFDASLLASPIRWLSAPQAVHTAELKICQLSQAMTLGLDIPATIVTNSADEAMRFASAFSSVVVKPVRYGLVADGYVAWTSRTTRAELAALDGTPVVVQQELRAAIHLRVVTVDQDCFLSQLQTDELDWRARLDNHQRFSALNSSAFPTVRDNALALTTALGVGYSSQDWIVDREGRPWFLDLNPSGQWLFVDDAHGGAITAALAIRLIALARDDG